MPKTLVNTGIFIVRLIVIFYIIDKMVISLSFCGERGTLPRQPQLITILVG